MSAVAGACHRCKNGYRWTARKGRRLKDAFCPNCGQSLQQTWHHAKRWWWGHRDMTPLFDAHRAAVLRLPRAPKEVTDALDRLISG